MALLLEYQGENKQSNNNKKNTFLVLIKGFYNNNKYLRSVEFLMEKFIRKEESGQVPLLPFIASLHLHLVA